MKVKAAKRVNSFLPEGFDRERSRRQGHRPKRRNILIICEGEKTEPSYFEAFRKCLVGGEGDRVVVRGLGMNTLNLIEEAQRLIDERNRSDDPPFYEVWIVFDKDDFPNDRFDATVQAIINADTKTKAGKLPHWYSAWSNEAFELWYLLHFQEMQGGAMGRDQLCALLTKKFQTELGVTEYRKNDPRNFELLESRMEGALRRAERALLACATKPPHACNPATRVFELVKRLNAYR